MNTASVGDLIAIDKERRYGVPDSEGGDGYITAVHTDGRFDIKYVLGGSEKNVDPSRIKSTSTLVLSARQQSPTDLQRPSILAPSHVPAPRRVLPTIPSPPPEGARGVSATLLQSYSWCTLTKTPNPLLKLLRDNRKKEKGWLRKAEKEFTVKEGEPTKQLNNVENNKLVDIKKELDRLFQVLQREWPKEYPSPIADLAHAYGVGNTKVRGCVKAYLNNNCSTTRKQRSDAGLTVFNSEKKRNEIYTPFFFFCKMQRIRNKGDILNNKQLSDAFKKLAPEVLQECERGAADLRRKIVNIESELQKVLQKTNGSVSWNNMAIFVAGGEDQVQPVGKTAIQEYIMSTDEFRYTATLTAPQCDNDRVKNWRMKWATNFHIFWEGGRLIRGKVQIVLFHIDEKWFYSLVVRLFNKCVPQLGVQPVHNRIHHKNSLDKTMGICTVAIAPHNNDLRNGGEAKKITMTRCGGYETAKRDSFGRVYAPDGSYTMPRTPENRLRVAGQDYWSNWEINGSKDESKGKKKFNLAKWVKETLLQPLKDYAQDIEQRTGKRVHCRGQWDNASPHVEKNLLRCIASLFGDLGWDWTRQPSNSPLTNVCDAALFPALAKQVTALQGM